MVSALTKDDLRAELADFARSSIRDELSRFQRHILEDLQSGGRSPYSLSQRLGVSACSQEDAWSAVEASACKSVLRREVLHGAAPPATDSAGEALLRGHSSPQYSPSSGSYMKRRSKRASHLGVEHEQTTDTVGRDLRVEGYAEKGSEGEDEAGPVSALCTSIVNLPGFDYASTCIVLANAAWVGMQANHVASTWSHECPPLFHTVDLVFCAVVCTELAIRILAKGCSFWTDAGWKWSWFDTLIAACQLADIFAHSRSSFSGLRALKLVRILRVARVAEAFPDLHILISSIIESMHSLFWTLVLIFLFLYGIALLILQTVSEHKIALGRDRIQDEQRELLTYFGSLDQTMLSLYMTLTQGIGWVDLLDPLALYISPWMKLIFVFFIGFQLFAMMNVITACFVDNAMKLAVKAEAKGVMNSLLSIIGGGSVDHEVLINEKDFENLLGYPQMTKFLELIGADQEDPEYVFSLIDSDGDGALGADEFLRGCLKLIGPAKAKDMARLAMESRAHLKEQDQRLERILQRSEASHQEVLRALTSVTSQIEQARKSPESAGSPNTPFRERSARDD
eukprot:TRINITY_DN143_c1_g1_i1.p1 TRINITY_DN143_c1_g1~~TRINITY_DN143_c1_g1_i1.p1  ORF type:complete len:568 (+),score=86.69 TRINITY_DN143_c1_g1_i1:295-1998(+)